MTANTTTTAPAAPGPSAPAGAEALIPITERPDTVFVRGEGSWLWDSGGRRYLDFTQGWAVNCLGHCPPEVAAALAEQSRTLVGCGPAWYSAPLLDYAARLAAATGMERCFLANSGAEANEGAIKLARKWGAVHRGGAYRIVTMEGGFHGRTLATMSASGKPGWNTVFEPKVPGFPRARLNDLASVEAAIDAETVAVMLEPVQGESGVWPAEDGFLAGLRELTGRRGLLLVLDEIQTGMGRTGRLLCCERAGVRPDILTLGKGIGAGAPLAAVLAREEVCCFAPGEQGGTFNGSALMCAVGLAVLEAVSAPGFLEHVEAASARLGAGLEALSARRGLGAVRGRGLLLALGLGARTDAAALSAAAFEAGLLLNAPRPDSLRFVPALNVGFGEIDAMLETLDGVLARA